MKLNKKILTLIYLILTASIAQAAVQGIDPMVYEEGVRRFSGARDIFRGQISDPDAWKAVKAEAEARMIAAVREVNAITSRSGKWVVTVYTNDPKNMRKTVIDREKVTINGNQFLLIATQDGCKIVDLKTNYDYLLTNKNIRR